MTTQLRSLPLSDLNQLPPGELFSEIINAKALDALIELAAGEDLAARGDITSMLLVPTDTHATANVVSRGQGILAGGVLLSRVAAKFDPTLKLDVQMADGADIFPRDRIATVTGPLRSILRAERTLLNFVSHLSGIATLTGKFVDAITGEEARIFDTRKTVPGLRRLAKYAVRCGGGYCHRIGLHDGVLIKDNHIARVPAPELSKVLKNAVDQARKLNPAPAFIEVEVDTLDQLRAVLGCDVDIILLDNMPIDQIRRAVSMRDELHPSVELEASGGVTLQNVLPIAQTGVDRIAVGALTHSAPALDVGMDITQ